MSIKKAILGLLLAIAGANILWLILSPYGDPGTFAVLYLLAAYAYFRENSLSPVFVMATFGLAIHGYYFATEAASHLTSTDRAFFVLNLLLPLPLLLLGGKAQRCAGAANPSS
jgi:hypothetical protein